MHNHRRLHTFLFRFERLELRQLLSGDRPVITAEWLNSLPDDAPIQFDAEIACGCGEFTTQDSGDPVVTGGTNVTTILNNGPTTNRIDIVLVGDGYTSADLPTFAANAQSTVANFFNEAPLSIYKTLFNVHRVDVVSNESGVDNDPVQGVLRDTALDMTFFCGGTERALCVNTFKAQQFANLAPAVDQVLALANSSKYGGVGYPSLNMGTFAAGNGSALEIARHEFGHSFADLADEYDYGGPTAYAGGDPAAANVSTLTASAMAAQQRKWYRWLDLPEVDTFEGANTSQTGIYRPTFDSKMRSLFSPWGPVNTEQLIISAYKAVRPIDSATPGGVYGTGAAFFVDPVDPVGNPLSVQWLLNGNPISGATGLTFNAATLGLTSGVHTLSARVRDDTTLVRDEGARTQWMTQLATWTIDAQGPVASQGTLQFQTAPQAVRVVFDESVFESVSPSDVIIRNLGDDMVIPSSAISVLYDGGVNAARFTFPGLPNTALPDGNYRVTIPAGSVSDSLGNATAADYSFDIFFLNADADRNRSVNIGDFGALASNFNRSPRGFSQGDFNYSGTVDIDDFAILAGRFNQTLPPAATRPAPAAAVVTATFSADRLDDERGLIRSIDV